LFVGIVYRLARDQRIGRHEIEHLDARVRHPHPIERIRVVRAENGRGERVALRDGQRLRRAAREVSGQVRGRRLGER
jgi:hypothetical protein